MDMRKSPFEHIRRSTLIRNERKTLISRISFLFGFFCVIGALLAPSDIPETNHMDRVIVPIIDNSLSMAVPDVGYKDGAINRFQAAKEVIKEMIQTYPEYSYGLFAFNSNPRIVAPITNAHETILNLLNGLGNANYQ